MKYNCINTNKTIELKDINNKPAVSRALGLHIKKFTGTSLSEFLYQFNKNKHFCGFCDNEVKSLSVLYKHDLENIEIYDTINSELFYCKQSGCPGKKLNPNSKEFISKSRNISLEEAHLLLLNRNSSPFYKHNHENVEAYKAYQNTYHRSSNEKQKLTSDKISKSLSKSKYLEKYGEIEGLKIWNDICNSKKVTKHNFIKLYGEVEGVKRYQNWIDLLSNSEKRFIKLYGEVEGIKKFKEYIDKINFLNEEKKKFKKQKYGLTCYSECGNYYFQSRLEFNFYKKMIENGLDLKNFSMHKKYKDSTMHSDFYFIDLDLHIEIAGMMHHESYQTKMMLKEQQFNCLIIESESDFDYYCDIIKNRFNERFKK